MAPRLGEHLEEELLPLGCAGSTQLSRAGKAQPPALQLPGQAGAAGTKAQAPPEVVVYVHLKINRGEDN